jgi:hypothetical protein
MSLLIIMEVLCCLLWNYNIYIMRHKMICKICVMLAMVIALTGCIGGGVGKLKWSYTIDIDETTTPVISQDGTIYLISTTARKLCAINPDGTHKWSISTSGTVSTPAIGVDGEIYIFESIPSTGADGKLNFQNTDQCLCAINLDGTTKWKFDISNAALTFSSPACASDGTIYIGSDKLYAVGINGKLKWSYSTSDPVGSPATAPGGTVYVNSGYNLHAINPNGKPKWSYTIGHTSYNRPVISADGTVYVSNYNMLSTDATEKNSLYAINPAGELEWTYTLAGPIHSVLAVSSDGTAYVGASSTSDEHGDFRLYAIKPSGILKWSFVLAGSDMFDESRTAVSNDGTVYVGCKSQGKLFAISPEGKLKWTYSTNNAAYSCPVIAADGTVYVSCFAPESKLYAFSK